MVKELLIIVGLIASSRAMAQSEVKDTVRIAEVEATATRVIKKADRNVYLPSETTMQAAGNTLELLLHLQLPGVLVNPLTSTIEAMNHQGEVQIRIDGVEATMTQLKAMPPQRVRNVQFIIHPSVRYGEGVQYVIDIATRRPDRGYALHTEVQHALTTKEGEGTAQISLFGGKNAWSFYGSGNYTDGRNSYFNETANYTLNDGTVATVERRMDAGRVKNDSQQAGIILNRVDSTLTQFQAHLSWSRNHKPFVENNIFTTEAKDNVYQGRRANSLTSLSPTLDLYLSHQLTEKQNITANIIVKHGAEHGQQLYDDGKPIHYATKGRSWGGLADLVYEIQWGKVRVSLGDQLQTNHARNTYEGDMATVLRMHKWTNMAFVNANVSWQKLFVQVGAGLNTYIYRQNDVRYHRTLSNAKLLLSYPLSDEITASYSLALSDHASQIANTSDVVLQRNKWEWERGNPALRPNRRIEQSLTLGRSVKRWSTDLWMMYRDNIHPNMMLWERTADNRFILTQENQHAIRFFMGMLSNNVEIVPQHLDASLTYSIARAWNYGDAYTHIYTGHVLSGYVRATLNKWQVMAMFDSGFNILEDETIMRNEKSTTLAAIYNTGTLRFVLQWANPFDRRHQTMDNELVNRWVNKRSTWWDTGQGNRLELKLTWNLQHGSNKADVERKKENTVERMNMLR